MRPGIWFRPLYDHSADIPAEWRLERNAEVFDISVPEVLEHIAQDIRQLGDWGYELIKHDFRPMISLAAGDLRWEPG